LLRLFLRLYLLLMLPATVAFVALVYVGDQVMAQVHAEDQRARAGVAFDRAERIINDQRVPDWQGRLKEIEATYRVEHEIVPLEKALADVFMSSSEKERLRAGDIAFRDRPGGGEVYLRRLRDSDRALRIEWLGAYEYQLIYYALVLALLSAVTCAILWRWIRPLWADLQGLTAATARVGGGDFAVRARVSRGSLLEPIASAFNNMAARIEALLRSHRDLEQGVAHELRTPLAQLKFDLELARSSAAEADRAERFAAMDNDVADLDELVGELLVLANLRHAPPYAPREVETQPLIDEALRRARDEMRAAGRDLAIEGPRAAPARITCDPKHLSRALANVLRNAIRYAHSKVALTVERDGARTTVSVDDDGPGVAPAERERLFEPFTRIEGSRGRSSGGVGLGLAIVKSIAEWHGGEARIAESPLGGARVSITW
jgi:two-component system, OmpR family, sensor kinase ParS